MARRPAVGHRSLAHTADISIEAWAPSRERCVAEAVAAVVDTFADVSGAEPTATTGFRVEPAPDEDVLMAVLDEIIYLLDTTGRLPVRADVAASGDGLEVRLSITDADRAELVGAVPKAVSWHDLWFGRDEAGWSCRVTLDV